LESDTALGTDRGHHGQILKRLMTLVTCADGGQDPVQPVEHDHHASGVHLEDDQHPRGWCGHLVNADLNEEGANMLMLQTRQSLGTTSLSLASQAAQSVMRLF
jgi:hypothetical protein